MSALRTLMLLLLFIRAQSLHYKRIKDFLEFKGPIRVSEDDVYTVAANGSPYFISRDITIEENGRLIIEPGVEIKFAPRAGIHVKGSLTAKGTDKKPIILTSIEPPEDYILPKDIRLVDGPSVLTGRLQLLHRGQWRSVCTAARNWAQSDFETACQQLGFQGGEFWDWLAPKNETSRLLYEQPDCEGDEETLFHCNNWSLRKMGGGVCDNHPDLGITCSKQHANISGINKYWRGIHFDNAQYKISQKAENAIYEHVSLSDLSFVDIRYAGVGKNYTVMSALHIDGVPPAMRGINVSNSAYDGINVNVSDASISIFQCNVSRNRGHGLYISHSLDPVNIFGCSFMENGDDGVRLTGLQGRPHEYYDRLETYDVCTTQTLDVQHFPTFIRAVQHEYLSKGRDCFQIIETKPGQIFTLHFLSMWADTGIENGAFIEVYNASILYKGYSIKDNFMRKVNITTGTRAQSITSNGNSMLIHFKGEPNMYASVVMKITAAYGPLDGIAVMNTTMAHNKGNGIKMENLQNSLHIYDSYAQNNSQAGIQVLHGVGNIFVGTSEIGSNNDGGINIAFSGGVQIFSECEISYNGGHGISIWPKKGAAYHYVSYEQHTILHSSLITSNEFGMGIGKFCRNSYIEIIENEFLENKNVVISISACTKDNGSNLKLLITHNAFVENQKLGIHFSPAVNIKGLIGNNEFIDNQQGCMLIKNEEKDNLDMLPVNLTISENIFKYNHGAYVVNFGLSPNSKVQNILFLKNTVTNNFIQEPFMLVPRNRAAAVIIVSSENIILSRNLIHNNKSTYEIATHLVNPNVVINCTLNWLGFSKIDDISPRIFDRGHRHNLAKITFIPFLLNVTDPGSLLTVDNQNYLPLFKLDDNNVIGGELSGTVYLQQGTYVVERDIHVLPNSTLILEPGVVLRFLPCIGMIISGYLEAVGGAGYDHIRFFLHKKRIDEEFQAKTPEISSYNGGNIRLIGGSKETEGQLQVKVGARWGTVCSHGWSKINAAIACYSLGLVLDPNNWYMKQKEIPYPNVNLPILLSNVQCTEEDTDIMSCKAERELDLESSCTHKDDVGLRCKSIAWAGIRFTLLAEKSKLDHVVVSNAGLLDYSTYSVKPAIQIDFAQHILKDVKIMNNTHDGLAIMHTNLYAPEDVNILKKSSIQDNGLNGIIMHQLGLQISDSELENNSLSGINYSPIIKSEQQKELVGWLKMYSNRDLMEETENTLDTLVVIPQYQNDTIYISAERTKLILTERVGPQLITQNIQIMCDPDQVIAIQILNSQQHGSTEEVIIYDGESVDNAIRSWNVEKDLLEFPIQTNSSTVLLYYSSGNNALGDIVFTVSAVPASQTTNDGLQDFKMVLKVTSSVIQYNKHGVKISFSGRCGEESEEMFIGSSKEVIQLEWCDIKQNYHEAIYIDSPVSYTCHPNIIETTVQISYSTLLSNGKVIFQSNRNYENTNNVFHWLLQNNNIEGNQGGGFEVTLPVFSDLSVTNIHSIKMTTNDWKNNNMFRFDISGGTASLNILENMFLFNYCETGLISIHGVEKSMRIASNRIHHNMGHYMLKFAAHSHSELIKEDDAFFIKNDLKLNQHFEDDTNAQQVLKEPSSTLYLCGIQKVVIKTNLFENNTMDYELIAAIHSGKLTSLIAKENWWGSVNEDYIQSRIMDFKERNSYAIVQYRPFLAFNDIGSPVASYQPDKDKIVSPFTGGPIYEHFTLEPANQPYIITNDITVMSNASLTIKPNVTIQFAPNIGILVLGSLYAKGRKNREINLLPLASPLKECDASNTKKPAARIGTEERHKDCHMNDQEACKKDRKFVCPSHAASMNKHTECGHWGGIRFVRPEFEDWTLKEVSKHRNIAYPTASLLEYVNIEGAGILHGHESPCVQIISHFTIVRHSNISSCASDGISIISTMYDTQLSFNRIQSAMGVGISITSFQGSRKDEVIPLSRTSNLKNPFGVLSMCDSSKIIHVKQRVLVYFQRRPFPAATVCLKTFKNIDKTKGLNFRFLHFSLFSSTDNSNIKESITFYDGDITSNTSVIIGRLYKNGTTQPPMISSNRSVLSVKLFLSEGSTENGFVAEVFTKDIQQAEIGTTEYNVSSCVIKDNKKGAIQYFSINEVKSIVSVEWNRFTRNCQLLDGNISTCKAAAHLEIHDAQAVTGFKNNLLKDNEGGLLLQTATNTALRVHITNNLFYKNKNNAALHVEAHKMGASQQCRIHRNFFIQNYSPPKSTIVLKQVTCNFSSNYLYNNRGYYILELPIGYYVQERELMQIAKNQFHQNKAVNEFRGTILAGVPGQRISDNAFLNPQSSYEIISMSTSFFSDGQNKIKLTDKWWGFTGTQQGSNETCMPPMANINDTCYTFVGVPMLFTETHSICEAINASQLADQKELSNIYPFLQSDQLNFYENRQLWALDKCNGKCLVYNTSAVEADRKCEQSHPFICAKGLVAEVKKKTSSAWIVILWVIIAFIMVMIISVACYRFLRRRQTYSLERPERELEVTHEVGQHATAVTVSEEPRDIETYL